MSNKPNRAKVKIKKLTDPAKIAKEVSVQWGAAMKDAMKEPTPDNVALAGSLCNLLLAAHHKNIVELELKDGRIFSAKGESPKAEPNEKEV